MNNPLVTICIPTLNGSKFLKQALDSIIAQTYNNIEVVVSDDSSMDSTVELLQEFKSKVNFPVSIYKHEPNGIGANWNNCIRKARGEYIKFLFQDDLLYPNCVHEMVTYLTENKSIGLVGCKRDIIIEGEKNESIEKWLSIYENLQSQIEEGDMVTILDSRFFSREDFLLPPLNKIGEPPTVMFKRKIVEEVGYFDEDLEQKLDYVFYYRILKKYPIAIINRPLASFRLHDKQATQINHKKRIPDRKRYDEILYKEFYTLLHPKHKKKLALKYCLKAKLINKLHRAFRRLRS